MCVARQEIFAPDSAGGSVRLNNSIEGFAEPPGGGYRHSGPGRSSAQRRHPATEPRLCAPGCNGLVTSPERMRVLRATGWTPTIHPIWT